MRSIDNIKVFRVIDANFNRTKEALRVCEDVSRFVLDNKKETAQYRRLRHEIEDLRSLLEKKKKGLAHARNIQMDVGKKDVPAEFKRCNVYDIFYANSQRIKESLRVLEEFSKLLNTKAAGQCKRIRYQIYALEQKISEQL
ncbi:MAG: thiamine-phosphate pyrophosphorylase [Candidatus Aceula meridiana]|nr:thiamine-phosphate pyrophosphorylase [Candidatus Aceula meridiana]